MTIVKSKKFFKRSLNLDEKQAIIALNMIPGLGSVKINRLIGHFKNPQNIFKAQENELLDVDGITEEIVREIREFNFNKLENELKESEKKNIKIFTIYDESYPELLKSIYDPPPVLYVAGNNFRKADLNLGIVGTRAATDYAEEVIKKIIREAKEAKINLTVISGMARGVDIIAHMQAIENGFFTVAVLGYGLNEIYPFEKNELVNAIYTKGILLSEFPLNTIATKQSFPIRNRVISGLSNGVLVVEAGEKSGALITADCALEQGRDVFAIPGSIFYKKSKGTNNLIKQGAKLVESFFDILDEYRIKYEIEKRADNTKIVELKGDEKKVFEILGVEKKHIDNIAIESNIDITKLNSVLTVLEMKGLIKQLSGKNFIKA